MSGRKNQQITSSTRPNLGRHSSQCSICAHPQRHQIEVDFVSWRSPATIATEYGLRDRSSVYRHGHALDLFSKRSRNLRAALERIIERVDEVAVTAGAIVQAVTIYARINSRGELIEQSEQFGLNELFERMSPDELEGYARDGSLPPWFTAVVGATGPHGPGGKENA